MKHLLNNLSEEEKNKIREQHNGGKKIMIENFNKLVNTKLGDARPLTEQSNNEYSYEVGKTYKMKRDIDGKIYNVKILRADKKSTPPNWYETEIDGGIGRRELGPNYNNTKKGLHGNMELGSFYNM